MAQTRSPGSAISVPYNLPGQSSAGGEDSAGTLALTGNEPTPAIHPTAEFAVPLAVIGGADDAALSMRVGGTLSETKSKPGEVLDFGPLRLINNVWGAPSDEALSSGVYIEADGSFGWYWDRPQPLTKPGESRVLPIYPGIRAGGSPWEASRSASFPVRLRDIKSMEFDLSFGYPATPTGTSNLAYDLFFTETNASSSTPAIKAEVMIWVLGTASQPADRYRGDFSDGHNTYALYSWIMASGRQYYAFVMRPGAGYQARHTVDARKLLDSVPLQPEWWMPGVELGTEVWLGAGKIQISRLGINLNSAELKSP